jgi:hypothetical protein
MLSLNTLIYAYFYKTGKIKMGTRTSHWPKLSKLPENIFCIFTFILFVYAYYDFSLFLSENYFIFWFILTLIVLFLLVISINRTTEINVPLISNVIKNKKIKKSVIIMLSPFPIIFILNELGISDEICHLVDVINLFSCDFYFYLAEKSIWLASISISLGMLVLVLVIIKLPSIMLSLLKKLTLSKGEAKD